MPNRLSAWFRRRSKQDTPTAPTFLPKTRPRPLTAIGENLETDSSPFFRLLPYEIRRQILVAAFGERTLHLNLRLVEHPPNSKARTRSRRHPNAQLLHLYQRDGSQPSTWVWWGSECQRKPAPDCWQAQWPSGTRTQEEWYIGERCHHRRIFPPELHDGPACYIGTGCCVGAMGWLRAGRRAYVEGVDVLYATNRFHVRSMRLTRWVPKSVLPQRLGAVRALEFVWTVRIADDAGAWRWLLRGGRGHQQRALENEYGLEAYRALLNMLPEVFPSLSWLYLSLEDYMHAYSSPPARTLPQEYLLRLLEPVDAMVERMDRLSECRVALPWNWYEACKEKGKRRVLLWYYGEDPEPQAMWRALPSSTDGAGAAHARASGYWIIRGREDRIYQDPITRCWS